MKTHFVITSEATKQSPLNPPPLAGEGMGGGSGLLRFARNDDVLKSATLMTAALPPPSATSAGVRHVSFHLIHRARALCVALLLVAAAILPATAGPFEDTVARFASDSFSDTEAAVNALATSGHPQAFAIVDALKDGRLLADPFRQARQGEDRGAGMAAPDLDRAGDRPDLLLQHQHVGGAPLGLVGER